MGHWRLNTLHVGGIEINKGVLTPGFDDDMKITVPWLAWLIRNDEHNILVDCGADEDLIIDGMVWGGHPAYGGEAILREELAKYDVTPDSIDTILFTHFHYDHVGNIDLFKNAKLIAQKDEWETINNQNFTQIESLVYDNNTINQLKNCKRFVCVDGDMTLFDGIQLIKVPGHTKGSQAIVVDSVFGRRIITGDILPKLCNAFPYLNYTYDMDGKRKPITPAPKHWPTIPTSLLLDYYAYYESLNKIKLYMPADEPKYLYCSHEAQAVFTEEN